MRASYFRAFLLDAIFNLAMSEFLKFPEQQPGVWRCNELVLDLIGCIDADL